MKGGRKPKPVSPKSKLKAGHKCVHCGFTIKIDKACTTKEATKCPNKILFNKLNNS